MSYFCFPAGETGLVNAGLLLFEIEQVFDLLVGVSFRSVLERRLVRAYCFLCN